MVFCKGFLENRYGLPPERFIWIRLIRCVGRSWYGTYDVDVISEQ